jgi:hypothetical protein
MVRWAGKEVVPLVESGELSYAARVPYDQGGVTIFGDDSLFQNAALIAGQNGAFVVALLQLLGGEVQIVDETTGQASTTPMEAVKRARLLPVVIELGIFLAALFVWRGAAFGRPRDPETRRRREFVEHVRAVGRLYARASAARHALKLYSGYALERLRERMRLRSGGQSLSALAEQVATRTGRPLGEVMGLLVSAHGARQEPVGNSNEEVELLRRLIDLTKETGGQR